MDRAGGEAGVPLLGCPAWRQFSLRVPSGAPPLLLVLLLLWVVGEPPGPCWRAGLGVGVLDSRPGRGMVVLVFRWGGGAVILSSILAGGMVILASMLGGRLILNLLSCGKTAVGLRRGRTLL